MPSSEETAVASTEIKPRTPRGQMIFGHIVLLIFCVGLPAFVTAVVPLTILHLSRENGVVNAEVSKRLLFVVPYSYTIVKDVRVMGDQFVAGTTQRSRNLSGEYRSVQTENAAFLNIQGAFGSAKIEVSPVNIQGVLKKIAAFVANPTQSNLHIVAVANWKFGVIVGGLLSLLTVLYFYIQITSLVQWITQKLGVIPEI